MRNDFEEVTFRDLSVENKKRSGNLIRAEDTKIKGKIKVSVEEEVGLGVKIILKKDENDAIKEIKFICSCGQTKSIILDYSE